MHASERRRHSRLEIDAEVVVRTSTEFLPGQALDISESGMSAILPVELDRGEEVELTIKLRPRTVTTRAVVSNRNVFRHGFEFLHPLREFAADQELLGDCEACAGTGFVIKPLGTSPGVAFGRVRCSECGGSGKARATRGPGG